MVRASVVAGLVLIVTLTASARPTPSPVPRSFEPDSATPYFTDGDAAEAGRQLRLQEWAPAARGFADYLARHAKAKDAAQAGFLRAWAELKSGQHDAAA